MSLSLADSDASVAKMLQDNKYIFNGRSETKITCFLSTVFDKKRVIEMPFHQKILLFLFCFLTLIVLFVCLICVCSVSWSVCQSVGQCVVVVGG